MAVVMDMSSYVVEGSSAVEAERNDRARCSGWNPQLELATQQHLVSLTDRHATLPVSLLTADAEMFLQKMYAFQC